MTLYERAFGILVDNRGHLRTSRDRLRSSRALLERSHIRLARMNSRIGAGSLRDSVAFGALRGSK